MRTSQKQEKSSLFDILGFPRLAYRVRGARCLGRALRDMKRICRDAKSAARSAAPSEVPDLLTFATWRVSDPETQTPK